MGQKSCNEIFQNDGLSIKNLRPAGIWVTFLEDVRKLWQNKATERAVDPVNPVKRRATELGLNKSIGTSSPGVGVKHGGTA